MRHLFHVCCLLIASHIVYGQQLQLSPPIRFIALGDSYTIGQSVDPAKNWPNQLYARLAAAGCATDKLQIIARTGWRTDNLASAIVTENPPADFNLVSLLIGVNDQYQGRPIANYEPAFTSLLDTAIKLAGGNKDHVFVVSIPDYAYTPYGRNNQNISTEIDAYNAINKRVADQYGITYFDITPISRQGLAEPDLVASDGLHPSALMYERWVDLMMEQLKANNTLSNASSSNHKKKVVFYPNPTSQTVNIDIEVSSLRNATYKIYNPVGGLLLTGKVENNPIDISSLPKSVYTIELKTDEESYREKLIIE